MKKLIVLVVVLACFTGSLSAQEEGYEILLPTADGHTFVYNSLIPVPNYKSAFHMRLGVESSVGIDFPPIFDILPDSIAGLDGSLVFVTLGFTYQQKIKDWIAFYANIGGAVRSGTEVSSLLFEGVNTVFGGETGLVFKIMDRPRHALGGKVSISNYNATIIDFRQFVADIIEGVPAPSVTTNSPALNIGIGLNYGFSISRVFGATGLAEVHYGESIARGEESFRLRVGAAGDANFAPMGVPIGLTMGYMARSTPDYVYVDKRVAHTLNLKLTYTGKHDIQLGLELTSSWVPLSSLPEHVRTVGATINILYFFN